MKKIFSTILFFGVMLCMTLLVDVKAYANVGDPLCFTAAVDNSSVALVKEGSPNAVSLETSTDGSDWTDYTIGNTIPLTSEGDKVYFRNKSESTTLFSKDPANHYYFKMTGKINASGDTTTLLKNTGNVLDLTGKDGCFTELFNADLGSYYNNTSLVTAPELPATTLAKSCYSKMFQNCTSLEAAPELPATTLAEGCYIYMFRNCKSLEVAPKLPATTLADNCYYMMFTDCSSLQYIKVYFKDWGTIDATKDWLVGTANSGKFVCPITLSAQYGNNFIPASWDIEELYYTIAFDTNGYVLTPNLNVPYGGFATYPGILVYGNKACIDWYKETECNNKWDFENDVVTNDITLYAKWIDANSVTFDVCDHGIAPSIQIFSPSKSNQHVSKPEDPTCDGYIFLGWYKENEYINKWNFEKDTFSNSITLYAKWKNISLIESINELLSNITSKALVVSDYAQKPDDFLLSNIYFSSENEVTSLNDFYSSEEKCFYYDSANKKLYIKLGEELQVTTSGGGSHTRVVYNDKEVIKEVEKIISPQTITVVDEKGNRRQAILNSDGTYTIIDSNIPVSTHTEKELQELKELEERKELLKTYPSKGIKLIIGLSECIIDGKKMEQDAPAEVIDGVTFLPIRLIAEYLGAKVSWDEKTPDKVEITKGSKKIILTIGSKVALVNGKEYTLDYAPYIKYDRTYLPVRFISEHLGAVVEWSEKSPYEIIIK